MRSPAVLGKGSEEQESGYRAGPGFVPGSTARHPWCGPHLREPSRWKEQWTVWGTGKEEGEAWLGL